MKWKRGHDNAYQTFGNRKGDSDSPGKLKALRLPNLKGKSLLDLGCNEGFFCIEAKKRGATRVVGLDKRPAVIEAAKQRAPEIDFRCQTWDTLPEGTFDVILLLSALHYAKDPQALLDRIYQALAPDGVLVLETGLSDNTLMQWGQAQRGNGSVWYPSKLLLIQSLLQKFAVRRMGKSVDQRGIGSEFAERGKNDRPRRVFVGPARDQSCPDQDAREKRICGLEYGAMRRIKSFFPMETSRQGEALLALARLVCTAIAISL